MLRSPQAILLRIAWIHCLPQNQKQELQSISHLVTVGRMVGGGDERDILNLFGHLISQLPPTSFSTSCASTHTPSITAAVIYYFLNTSCFCCLMLCKI